MPKVSKATATKEEFGPVTDCSAEVDGYRIGFATFHQDIDGTPLMKGLPNDMCQCPHWGYVLKGQLRFQVGDREEVFEAGDAFYLPPGHVGIGNEPGTELVQFSPAEELLQVSETITKNMQAMQGGD